MDIASAYRMVPIHREDKPLLAIRWAGKVFFGTRLQFGLRSALKIFMVLANALRWVFEQHSVTWVAHYLDDYTTMGSISQYLKEQPRNHASYYYYSQQPLGNVKAQPQC